MSRCVVCKCCYDGHSSHKKDSTWAWFVCLGASTNLFFTTGLIFSFGVLLPVFIDYFKQSRERTAWVGSLSVAFTLAAGPFAGSLINRFGCRAVSMVGCLTCGISLTVASFAESLVFLFISYGVLGIGAGCVLVSSIVVVKNSFDKRQSIALGITAAGQGLGTMALSQVLQSLVTAVHWKNTLRIAGGALFLNSFFGILYDSKVQRENVSSTEVLSCEEAEHEERSRHLNFYCSVWKVPGFLVLAASAALFMFGRATNVVHLVKYAQDLGISSDASSRLVLYVGGTVAIGRFATGFLCSIKRLNNWYILQSATLISGISMILVTLAHNNKNNNYYAPLVAYALVFGFCDGAIMTAFNILALTCVDHARAASSFGHMLMILSVTSLVGPPISGFIADSVGSYGPAFLLSGSLFITASLIPFVMLCVNRSSQPNTPESLILEKDTGNVQEGEKSGYAKRTRSSINEELKAIYVSSV